MLAIYKDYYYTILSNNKYVYLKNEQGNIVVLCGKVITKLRCFYQTLIYDKIKANTY